MKNRKLPALLLAAAMLAASGCGEPVTVAAHTAAPQTSRAAAATETAAPETTTSAEETEPPHKVTHTLIYTDASGKDYYLEDAVSVNEDIYMVEYGSAVMRIASGTYHDSDSEPGLFRPEEYIYHGETAGMGGTIQLTAGDKIHGCTVASASTEIMYFEDTDSGKTEYRPFSTNVTLAGEVTLSGVLRYYYDEQYAIASGDILFIPDSSYKGMPMPFGLAGDDYMYGVTDFDPAGGFDEELGYTDTYWGGNVCVYSDAPRFFVGNLLSDYADRSDLFTLLDGGNANCTRRVEITLSDVSLGWSDQFGTMRCSASIVRSLDISEG